jgi:hypothetical protein
MYQAHSGITRLHIHAGGPSKQLHLSCFPTVAAGKQPPFVGKVLSIERLGGRDRERDVSHIVIDTGGVQYVEGQSFGVQPPVRAEFSFGRGSLGVSREAGAECMLQ